MNDAGLPLLFRQNIIGIVYTNYGFAVYALTGGKHVVNAWYLLKMYLWIVNAKYMRLAIIRIKYINISTTKCHLGLIREMSVEGQTYFGKGR